MRAQRNKKKMMMAVTAGFILSLIIFGYLNNLNKSLKEKESKLKENETLLSSLQAKNGAISSIISGPRGFALVAKSNLYAGTKLRSGMLESREVALRDIETQVFQVPEELNGKVLLTNISAGQPVLKSNIDLGSFDIPIGMRAITIPMEFIQGLASSISVGSRVDVVSASMNGSSEVVAQNVKVISFEKNGSRDQGMSPNSPNTLSAITVEIPPNASSKIVGATARGKVQLLLRNSKDKSVIKPPAKPINPITQKRDVTLPPPPSALTPINNVNKKTLPELPQPINPMQSKPGAGSPKVELIKADEKQDVLFNSNNL